MALRTEEFIITGMHCAACVSRIEKVVGKVEGVSQVKVNLLTEKATLTIDDDLVTIYDIEKVVEQLGFCAYSTSEVETQEHDEVSTPMALDDFFDSIDYDENGVFPHEKKESSSQSDVVLTKDHELYEDGYPIDAPLGPFARRRTPLKGKVKSQKERREEEMRNMMKNIIASTFLLAPMILDALGGRLFGWKPLPVWISFVFAFIAIIGPGSTFIRGGWHALKNKSLTMDVLVSLGVLVAFIVSSFNAFLHRPQTYFETVVWLTTFILIGRALELRAKGRTSTAIEKLVNLQVKEATIIENGVECKVALGDVAVGNHLVVKPFETVPVDGVIIEGQSTLNEAMITGESLPVEKNVGDNVIGTTQNCNGTFIMEAQRVGKETLLAKIISTVEDAQASKAPIQRIADTVSGYFVIAVLVIAVLTFVGWIFIGHETVEAALLHMAAVMMIACPCALGLATPTSIMVGSGLGAEHGILVKDATTLEEASHVNAIVFDKTGTITKGELSVELSYIAESHSALRDDILVYLASLEGKTNHPVGVALIRYCEEKGVQTREITEFTELPGKGVQALVDGKKIRIGRRDWLEEEEIEVAPLAVGLAQVASAGMTLVIMAIDNDAVGLWGIVDTVRPEAVNVFATLHARNVETWMITGDNQETAEKIAKQVGVQHVIAGVLPQDKMKHIKALKEQGKFVGMIGDGINDAPALAEAHVSWAIGNGTEVAIESAQIVLVRNNLEGLLSSLTLSHKTLVNIKQNLFWAFLFNSIGIPLAAFGILTPAFAGTAMALSSVTVVTNALRLKTQKI